MTLYVDLEVSQKETEICVIDGDGRRTWRGKCSSEPECIAMALREHAPDAVRVGMETGPLAIWLWHGLRALDVPIDCIHARHVAAALSLQVNKTDVNDAFGIAQVVRSGWYPARRHQEPAELSYPSPALSQKRTRRDSYDALQSNSWSTEDLRRGARSR